jgi:hypothetical protein
MRNDCHNHETQMDIGLVSWEIALKWVLYSKEEKPSPPMTPKIRCKYQIALGGKI